LVQLAALILTDDDGAMSSAPPRALLKVAGQSLIEYQVRIAHAAGCQHIVVLVDQLPAGLVAAFDRLRDDGITIDIARSARDAADRFHPQEHVLVMASGVIGDRVTIERVARHAAPVILSVARAGENDGFERIDADDRWSGLALVEGQLIRDTAIMLGEWMLGPTLLRTALQNRTLRERGEGVFIVRNAKEAAAASGQLIGAIGVHGHTGLTRAIVNPLMRRILPRLVDAPVPFEVVAVAPLALLVVAIGLGAFGLGLSSYALYLLSSLPAAAASSMASASSRISKPLMLYVQGHIAAVCILLLASGWYQRAALGETSALVCAVWASVALLLQPRKVARSRWMADGDSVAVIMLGACVAGQPVVGLILTVVFAVVTQYRMVEALRVFNTS
jgi:hypothetical protein